MEAVAAFVTSEAPRNEPAGAPGRHDAMHEVADEPILGGYDGAAELFRRA